MALRHYSNSHGHNDVAILPGYAFARRTHFTGALLVFQLKRHMLLRNHAEKIEQVLRIEPDLEIGPVILAGNAFLALAHLYRRGKNADLALRKLHADSPRPLIGELGH